MKNMIKIEKEIINIIPYLKEENFIEIFDFFDKINFSEINLESNDIFFNKKSNLFVLGGNQEDLIYRITISLINNSKTKKNSAIEECISKLSKTNKKNDKEELKNLLFKSAKSKFNNRYKKEMKFIMNDNLSIDGFWKSFKSREISLSSLDEEAVLELIITRVSGMSIKVYIEEALECIKDYILDFVSPEKLSKWCYNNPNHSRILMQKICLKLPKDYNKSFLNNLTTLLDYDSLLKFKMIENIHILSDYIHYYSHFDNLTLTSKEKGILIGFINQNAIRTENKAWSTSLYL